MKTVAIVVGAVLLVLAGCIFLFVRWANQPENVAALQKDRAEKALKEEQEAKALEVQQAEIEAKKATLEVVFEETFEHGRFDHLTYPYESSSQYSFKDHQFTFSTLITKGESARDYFILTEKDYSEFIAEMTLSVWGTHMMGGIVFDALPLGDKYPKEYKAAYSSPNYNFVKNEETERFKLGGLIEAENNQTIRVERLGGNLKVVVNNKLLYDKPVAPGKGKIGIYLSHYSGGDYPESVSVEVKKFKVAVPAP